jgi:Conserved secreted protein
MKIRAHVLLISLISIFAFTGCSSGLFGMLEKPKAKLVNVYPRGTTMTGTTLVFVVEVENPNNKDIKVNSVDYKVFLSGKEFSQGTTDKEILVPANKTANVEVPLAVKYQDILNNLGDILMANKVEYKIEGKAKLSFISIPFTKEGKVELR